ncbi:MAG: hypothetical protein ABR562_07845 [Thermoplasmatota archaeon]
MRTEVEHRRFRTWESDASAAAAPWRIIAKYGFLRMSRTWYVQLLAVLTVVVAVTALASMAQSMSDGGAPGYREVVGTSVTLLIPGIAFLVLIGMPILAEDVRFNAHLFYFSRPLRPADYLRGKATQVAATVGGASLVPMAALLVTGAILGSAAGVPASIHGRPVTDAERDSYGLEHIVGLGDWLFTAVVILAGSFLILAFLTAATLLASSYTKRGWHAGMAVVAAVGGWSLLGAVADFGAKGAYRDLFGPVGWFNLVLNTPLSLHFRPSGVSAPEGAQAAVPLAYVIMIAATAAIVKATYDRVRRVEAMA